MPRVHARRRVSQGRPIERAKLIRTCRTYGAASAVKSTELVLRRSTTGEEPNQLDVALPAGSVVNDSMPSLLYDRARTTACGYVSTVSL